MVFEKVMGRPLFLPRSKGLQLVCDSSETLPRSGWRWGMRCTEDFEVSCYSQLTSMLAVSVTWEITIQELGTYVAFLERKLHGWQNPLGTLSLGFGLHLGKVDLNPGAACLSWNSKPWALVSASVSSSVKQGSQQYLPCRLLWGWHEFSFTIIRTRPGMLQAHHRVWELK